MWFPLSSLFPCPLNDVSLYAYTYNATFGQGTLTVSSLLHVTLARHKARQYTNAEMRSGTNDG